MLAERQWEMIFGAAQKRGARWPDNSDVLAFKQEVEDAIKNVIVVVAPVPQTGRRIGERGIALMHEFESCKLKAYPDPGSKDGLPVTIGWGSTRDENGNPIKLGTVWTQERADARFAHDINEVYGAAVDRLLGDSPTTQSQFDAMVSLTYNIGIGAFTRSTVLRKHKAGDFVGAARAFLMWNKNDGKVMRGLTRRRLAEADLYDDDGVPA